MRAPEPALRTLVLAGGFSRRMGRDKWAMEYVPGVTQLERVTALVRSVCRDVAISVREGQDVPRPPGTHFLVDAAGVRGPIAGIMAAFEADPDAAWLVAACDLPLLDHETADFLVAQRDATRMATAFRSRFDGLPEPLFAIWEPAAADHVRESIARDVRCPRRILRSGGVLLLDLPVTAALDNVNTPEEADEARKIILESM